MNYKEFREHTKSILFKEKASLVEYKAGSKKQYNVDLKKKGKNIVAYIDGIELDSFEDEREAKKAVDDYIKMIGD